jgi:hypothetical protein
MQNRKFVPYLVAIHMFAVGRRGTQECRKEQRSTRSTRTRMRAHTHSRNARHASQEDVDAACSVVRRRGDDASTTTTTTVTRAMRRDAGDGSCTLEMTRQTSTTLLDFDDDVGASGRPDPADASAHGTRGACVASSPFGGGAEAASNAAADSAFVGRPRGEVVQQLAASLAKDPSKLKAIKDGLVQNGAHDNGSQPVTRSRVVAWPCRSVGLSLHPSTWQRRLGLVRLLQPVLHTFTPNRPHHSMQRARV